MARRRSQLLVVTSDSVPHPISRVANQDNSLLPGVSCQRMRLVLRQLHKCLGLRPLREMGTTNLATVNRLNNLHRGVMRQVVDSSLLHGIDRAIGPGAAAKRIDNVF